MKKTLLIIYCVLTCFAVAVFVYYSVERTNLYTERTIEAGNVPDADIFIKDGTGAYFVEGSAYADTSLPGTYAMILRKGLVNHAVTLDIVDTTAPAALTRPVDIELGEKCAEMDFIERITDATDVSVSYVDTPDYARVGDQQVKLRLVDAGNNESIVTSSLHINGTVESLTIEAGDAVPEASEFLLEDSYTATYATAPEEAISRSVGDHEMEIMVDGAACHSVLHVVDTTPPVITDAKDLTVFIGQNMDLWMGVNASDNADGELEKRLDTDAPLDDSGLFAEAGSYTLVYTAIDASSNMTQVPVTVRVRTPAPAAPKTGNSTVTYDIDWLWAKCDEILAQITTPDMTIEQKVTAIWGYPRKHTGWLGYSVHGNWVQGAIDCINRKGGDCFAFASCTYALFQRAGIRAGMIARKQPASTEHYWNIVDIGDGWRHVDPTIFRDKTQIILWTTEQILYDNVHHDHHHDYDPLAYPELATGSATVVINPSKDPNSPR